MQYIVACFLIVNHKNLISDMLTVPGDIYLQKWSLISAGTFVYNIRVKTNTQSCLLALPSHFDCIYHEFQYFRGPVLDYCCCIFLYASSCICTIVLPYWSQASHGYRTCWDNISICWSSGIKRFKWELEGGWFERDAHNAAEKAAIKSGSSFKNRYFSKISIQLLLGYYYYFLISNQLLLAVTPSRIVILVYPHSQFWSYPSK